MNELESTDWEVYKNFRKLWNALTDPCDCEVEKYEMKDDVAHATIRCSGGTVFEAIVRLMK